MINKIISTSLIAILSCVATGCSSIISDSNYPVSFTSTPQGAGVEVVDENGQIVFRGRTPTTITLSSSNGYFDKASYTVNANAQGYGKTTMPLEASIDGWYFGNLLFGGFIGMLVVDPVTGNMWNLPESVHLNLNKSYGKRGRKSVHIVSINQIPSELRHLLVPYGSAVKNKQFDTHNLSPGKQRMYEEKLYELIEGIFMKKVGIS